MSTFQNETTLLADRCPKRPHNFQVEIAACLVGQPHRTIAKCWRPVRATITHWATSICVTNVKAIGLVDVIGTEKPRLTLCIAASYCCLPSIPENKRTYHRESPWEDSTSGTLPIHQKWLVVHDWDLPFTPSPSPPLSFTQPPASRGLLSYLKSPQATFTVVQSACGCVESQQAKRAGL